MLAEVKLVLKSNEQQIGYYQSSNLQGVLMEHINTEYADLLHSQRFNPYSQCITIQDQKAVWSIKTLDEEAYKNILLPVIDKEFSEFEISKKGIHVEILEKQIKTKKKQELLEEFYEKPASKYLNIELMTPTSFKSNGRYVIMPDVRYIYQSLMNKYSAASSDMEMYDEETLEQLAECSEIAQYKLRSTFFPLEGIKIPAFKGEISIRLKGTDTMARYARMLMQFGEYSGIGIKTSIGMGALRVH